jgi:hypothetical protein
VHGGRLLLRVADVGLDATSDGGPGWLDYLEATYRHVWAKDFRAKEIYLGVRLGQRGMGAQLSGGVLSQFINAYQAGERAVGLDDEAVPAAEIAKWTEQADRFGRVVVFRSLQDCVSCAVLKARCRTCRAIGPMIASQRCPVQASRPALRGWPLRCTPRSSSTCSAGRDT